MLTITYNILTPKSKALNNTDKQCILKDMNILARSWNL